MPPSVRITWERTRSSRSTSRRIRPAAALLAAAIEDHLDVRVFLKPLQQILVEAGFMVGDQKEMSSHARLHYLLSQHLQCHFRKS